METLEKTKASLAQELVNLSNRLEELESDSQELVKVKASYEVCLDDLPNFVSGII